MTDEIIQYMQSMLDALGRADHLSYWDKYEIADELATMALAASHRFMELDEAEEAKRDAA